ncbi:hypothetical protein [Nocardia asiatica]|uniref:hypothetical protein n=1 Tax=Nocardia asiatica TaxID=209252 RepID=UPI0002E28146|nr:hypothetical protein [Nocardia asiatica]
MIEQVTAAFDRARAEMERQETALRTIIRDAAREDTASIADIAAAACSPQRIYQIRDGRR